MSSAETADESAATAAVRPESRAMIEKLIAFDTTSHKSNLELIGFVQAYLADLGVDCELTYDDDERKANLYATLGPSDKGGIALSGHTDVVPVEGQEWSSDPFSVLEKDGRLYGRGTSDMKSFIAVALSYAPHFLAAGLKTPIHYCFSFDEEVGCIGVPRLLKALAQKPVRPRACIVGEPTDMKVVTAHKGMLSLVCRVRGLECHSSLAPQGVNAVQAAARVIVKLEDMARQKATEGPFDPGYSVPYTTIHTGVVQGGTALNIVPKDCSFVFEFRSLPEDDGEALLAEVKRYAHEEIEPAMKAVSPETGFDWEPRSSFPGLQTPEDAEVVALAKALTGANTTGKVPYGTEAGLFQESGIPVVVCGPGNIAQAHKPDEFIELAQVALCERFMERLIERTTQA